MIRIDGYPIDVALREEPTFDSEVTQYPVETGADLVDHVQIKPVTIVLEGIVSDTPFGKIADERAAFVGITSQEAWKSNNGWSADGYARLKEIFEAREPVSIEISRGIFDNMVLQSLAVPSVSNDGDMLHFIATFVQIRIVTVIAVAVEVRAHSKKNLGTLTLEQQALLREDELRIGREALEFLSKANLQPRTPAPTAEQLERQFPPGSQPKPFKFVGEDTARKYGLIF